MLQWFPDTAWKQQVIGLEASIRKAGPEALKFPVTPTWPKWQQGHLGNASLFLNSHHLGTTDMGSDSTGKSLTNKLHVFGSVSILDKCDQTQAPLCQMERRTALLKSFKMVLSCTKMTCPILLIFRDYELGKFLWLSVRF